MDNETASEVIALYGDNYQYGPSFPVMMMVYGTSSRPQNDIGRCLGPCIRFRGFGVTGSGLEGLGVRVRVWDVEFQVIGYGAQASRGLWFLGWRPSHDKHLQGQGTQHHAGLSPRKTHDFPSTPRFSPHTSPRKKTCLGTVENASGC